MEKEKLDIESMTEEEFQEYLEGKTEEGLTRRDLYKAYFQGIVEESKHSIPVNAMIQCATCKHMIPRSLRCKAFPEGVPLKMRHGEFDHTEPYPGDHGIRYEPRDPSRTASAPYARNKGRKSDQE